MNDNEDKKKDKVEEHIKFYSVLTLLVIFIFFAIFTTVILMNYNTVENFVTGKITTGYPDPTDPADLTETEALDSNEVIQQTEESELEIAIRDFANQYFVVLCGGETSNELVNDYFENCMLQEVPYQTPKESIMDDIYILNAMGGEWDDNKYEEMLANGEITLPVDDPDDSDPNVQVIDGKPYINVNDLEFNEDGVASVKYMGHRYVMLRSNVGFMPGQFLNRYESTDFFLENIVEQQPVDDFKRYTAYFKTYDGEFIVGLDITFEDDNSVKSFHIVYS